MMPGGPPLPSNSPNPGWPGQQAAANAQQAGLTAAANAQQAALYGQQAAAQAEQLRRLRQRPATPPGLSAPHRRG